MQSDSTAIDSRSAVVQTRNRVPTVSSVARLLLASSGCVALACAACAGDDSAGSGPMDMSGDMGGATASDALGSTMSNESTNTMTASGSGATTTDSTGVGSQSDPGGSAGGASIDMTQTDAGMARMDGAGGMEMPDAGPDEMTAPDASEHDDALAGGLWIAPDGSDAAPGTREMPLGSLPAALERAGPGSMIWVTAGTYHPSDTIAIRSGGEDGSPLQIFAAPGERPVFDFSAQPRGDSSSRGIQLSASYVHIRGIDFIDAGDNCIHISGSYNTIEHVVTSGCNDTGIQITANSSEADDPSRAAHNTVINCDSHDNYDAQNRGENADGFAAKLYIGEGNVFRGCRAWNNADDGWDLFASDDVVVIEDCYAIANGKIGLGQDNTNGDGNGFKLGGAARAGDSNMGGAVHLVRNCISLDNRACGFTRNNNTVAPQLTMCGGRGDGRGTLCSLTNSGDINVQVTAAQVLAAERDSDGNLPPL